MHFEYSFVIRTLGTAGEKYQALLDSIKELTIKPCEVIVVLPEGYAPPKERLGGERFVFTPKGMIAQRALCLNEIKTKYALFSDDDWRFEPHLVDKLAKPIQEGRADVTFPVFPDLLPQGFMTRLVMASIGSAVPMLFPKNRFTRILSSGSYAYNPYINNLTKGEFVAESAPGLCFFVKVKDFKDLHFEDEMWVQDTGYAFPDDQVMFYKWYLRGKRIIGIAGVDFEHLDAGGNSPGRAVKACYAMARNKQIFWHRFIYLRQPTKWLRRKVIYSKKWCELKSEIFNNIQFLLGKSPEELRQAAKNGRRDGELLINSDTYRQLPSIYRKD